MLLLSQSKLTNKWIAMSIEHQKYNVIVRLSQLDDNDAVRSVIKKLTCDNKSALNADCLTLENIGAVLLYLNGLSMSFKVQQDVFFLEESLEILITTMRNKSLSDKRYGITS